MRRLVIVILTVLAVVSGSQAKVEPAMGTTDGLQALTVLPLVDGTAAVVVWNAGVGVVQVNISHGFSLDETVGFVAGVIGTGEQIILAACGQNLWVGSGSHIQRVELPAAVCVCKQEVIYIPALGR